VEQVIGAVTLIGAVVGLVGLVGVAWAIARVKTLETTLDILSKSNAALLAVNSEQERRIGVLEGQIKLLESGLIDRIVTAVESRINGGRT
jgi:hypothetical protein